MKRQIKFRAWDSEEKKMMPVKSIDWADNLCTVDEGDNTITDHIEMFTLMQYIGLKDKNGNEIYEGDVLKSFYHRDKTGTDIKYTQETVEIEIDNYCGKIGFEILFPENSEIIGNIYQNPDLLTN